MLSRRSRFLALLDALPDSPHFGVQYDPSNAVVGGFDPIAFLERIKHRVVTMHASDRYLVPGTTLEEITVQDGTVGYPDKLKHGETGQGANDYDAIFRILRDAGFSGWISVEDGMNGLDELRRSVEFLKKKRAQVPTSPRSPQADLKVRPTVRPPSPASETSMCRADLQVRLRKALKRPGSQLPLIV